MVFQPNYRFKKAMRQRVKQSRVSGQLPAETKTEDMDTPDPVAGADVRAEVVEEAEREP